MTDRNERCKDEPDRLARWCRRVPVRLLAIISVLGIASCSGKREPDANGNMTMRPSITYLHLLKHTPFFTALTKSQLQWVIDHSREWEADSGAVIAKCEGMADHGAPYWILLDGGWQIEFKGETYPSGHADPGKWFRAANVPADGCRLVTNARSYVMRIEYPDMQSMLDQEFAFRPHLETGVSYYKSIFGNSDKER
ncbi:hypothetical protein [Paraburkholderia sp. BR14320]|uniref:hypothetical protein n=1 Tax=unclassified Paraburkholderia TaxID=2615204 RepID=UPI0034CFC81A